MTKGHNSLDAGRLHSFVQRIEKLNEEKANLTADIGEVFKEAHGEGYDKPTLRALIRERKMDAADRAEREELLRLYRNAITA